MSDIGDGVGDVYDAGLVHSSLLVAGVSVLRSSRIDNGFGVGIGAASAHSEGSRGAGVLVCVLHSAVVGVDGGGVAVAVVVLVVVPVVLVVVGVGGRRFCRRRLSLVCRTSCKRLIRLRRVLSLLSLPSSSSSSVIGMKEGAAGENWGDGRYAGAVGESCSGLLARVLAGSIFCRLCLMGLKSASLWLLAVLVGVSGSSLSSLLLKYLAVVGSSLPLSFA